MKRYALITVGFTPPSSEMMHQWMTWFNQLKAHTKNQMGFSKGFKIKDGEVLELPFDREALTGILEIEVESEALALELASACPAITETRVYEIRNQNKKQ